MIFLSSSSASRTSGASRNRDWSGIFVRICLKVWLVAVMGLLVVPWGSFGLLNWGCLGFLGGMMGYAWGMQGTNFWDEFFDL